MSNQTTTATRQEYMYNFESGGWNSQHATSPEEAYELACERWKDSPNLTPIKSTFKPVNENRQAYESALRMFW